MSHNPPKANIVNVEGLNDLIPSITTNMAHWHHKRNLVEGTTDAKQFVKLFEELIEVFCAIHPHKEPIIISSDIIDITRQLYSDNRIKQSTDPIHDMKDGIGDVIVVLINLCERNGFTLEECMQQAYNAIKDRRGRMINGMFYKEEDLDAQGNPKSPL